MTTESVARLLAGIAAAGLLAGCSPVMDPIPQDSSVASTSASDAELEAEEISACDRVREAFLTGTERQQTSALKLLQKDRSADATAREYAKYWLVRDKGDAQQQEMDESLIVMSCAL